VNPLWQEHW